MNRTRTLPTSLARSAWARLARPAALARVAGLTALLLVAGCARVYSVFDDASSPERVFAVGFENLTDRYIEPVDTAAVSMSGLDALSLVDDSIRVSRSGGSVRLTVGDEVASEHAAPGPRDVYGWARLTAAVIADARRNSPALRGSSNDDLYEIVFRGALKGFDRYSRYTTPAVARRNRAAREGFGGLGITIDQEDGDTVITQVHRGTPAARAGLRVDDRILRVDGKPIRGLAMTTVVGLLRGNVDTPVRLTVARPGRTARLELTVVRAHIILPTVTVLRRGAYLQIKISSFNQGTAPGLRRALARAEREMGDELKGVILDLRGNPGGLLDQAVAVADLFLGGGRIISTKGRHPESNQIFDATPGQLAATLPLAVLVNGKSASAAEIVAVALRDTGRAVVLGSTSYGKGTVQTVARLPNGGEMILTWARIHAPSGQTLDHQGIVPAICTDGAPEQIAEMMRALRLARESGAPLPAGRVRRQGDTPHFSREGRDACPPSPAQSPADIEAARLLLGNGTAYAQAVSDGTPSIARR